MTPTAEGDATFVFIDWSTASEHDPRTAADPARGQYREAYVVIPVTFGGQRAARVPYIWVDNDLSFARGLIQGDTSQTCSQRTSVEGGKRADGAAKGRQTPVIPGHLRSLTVTRKPPLTWPHSLWSATMQISGGGFDSPQLHRVPKWPLTRPLGRKKRTANSPQRSAGSLTRGNAGRSGRGKPRGYPPPAVPIRSRNTRSASRDRDHSR